MGPMEKNKASSNSPGKNGDIQFNKKANQATLKLNNTSVLVWRRALIQRYFKILGDEENIQVKWCDFDHACRPTTINDDQKKFEWKMPSENLFKSTTHVTIDKKTKFVITLFYSTGTGSVQGNYTSKWIDEEYTLINKTVSEIMKAKKDNPNVDKILRNIEFEGELLTISHANDSSTIKEAPIAKESENLEQKHVSPPSRTPSLDRNNGNKSEPEVQNAEINKKVVENEKSIHTLKDVIHTLENDRIDKDKQIISLVTVCTEMREEIKDLKTQLIEFKQIMKEGMEGARSHETGMKQIMSEGIKALETEVKKSLSNGFQTQSIDVNKSLNEIKETTKKQNENDLIIEKVSEVLQNKVMPEITINIDKKVTETLDNVKECIKRLEEIELKQKQNPEKPNKKSNENKHDKDKKDFKDSDNESEQDDEDKQNFDIEDEIFTHDVWIIGTSIVKDIDSSQMYRNKRVRVTTLWDKTVKGATELLQSRKLKVNPKILLLQVGSNDLENHTQEEVVRDIEELIKAAKNVMPNAKILISELLPRYYGDIHMVTQFEQKRVSYNALLSELCNITTGVEIVKFNIFKVDNFYDGIHLNPKGIGRYVNNIKHVLNPLLGINIINHRQRQEPGVNVHETQRKNTYMYGNRSEGMDHNRRFNENHNREGPMYYKIDDQRRYQRYNNQSPQMYEKNIDQGRDFYENKNRFGANVQNNAQQYNARFKQGFAKENMFRLLNQMMSEM